MISDIEPTDEDNPDSPVPFSAQAEKFKNEGNAAFREENYWVAEQLYSDALFSSPNNPGKALTINNYGFLAINSSFNLNYLLIFIVLVLFFSFIIELCCSVGSSKLSRGSLSLFSSCSKSSTNHSKLQGQGQQLTL